AAPPLPRLLEPALQLLAHLVARRLRERIARLPEPLDEGLALRLGAQPEEHLALPRRHQRIDLLQPRTVVGGNPRGRAVGAGLRDRETQGKDGQKEDQTESFHRSHPPAGAERLGIDPRAQPRGHSKTRARGEARTTRTPRARNPALSWV